MIILSSAAPIEGGMSGSPILSEDGKAIGVVITGTEALT
jgi:V8-like Glu-specific endopeptidase